MSRNKIKFFAGNLSYQKFGEGEAVLICFHGFGQSSEAYTHFFKFFNKKFTLYSIDLFYHGDSEWDTRKQQLTKSEWADVFKQFITKEKIQRFSLIAYSLGGKFALATVEHYAKQIEKLILIAPDGLKTQYWYDLSNYPPAFKRFFRGMILKPKMYKHLIRYSHKVGILSNSIVRFTQREMDTRAKRRRFYLSWVNFKDFTYHWPSIKTLLNLNSIQLVLVSGKYDKIISPGNMEEFLNDIPRSKHIILESGHHQLIETSAHYFKKHPESLLSDKS